MAEQERYPMEFGRLLTIMHDFFAHGSPISARIYDEKTVSADDPSNAEPEHVGLLSDLNDGAKGLTFEVIPDGEDHSARRLTISSPRAQVVAVWFYNAERTKRIYLVGCDNGKVLEVQF